MMKSLAAIFKRGPAEASATEFREALTAAEGERQQLREREQALAVSRQNALLGGTDEDLDAIEAELATVQRAAERHDLRIPELRRLHAERQSAEQRAADKRDFEDAGARRLAIAEQIDGKLAELGMLFNELDQTGEILRRLDGYHGASRIVMGPMSEFRLDRQAVSMALVEHVPQVARALDIREGGGHRGESYRSFEARTWSRISGGPERVVPRQEPVVITADQAEAEARERQLANRIR